MKLSKRFVSALLAALLCFTLAAPAFADEAEQNAAYKDYQSVFVHGLFGWGPEDDINSILPYWGMSSGNMLEYLTGHGYSVTAASVGPMSSCWDRCCELYAQLTGTVTDYGEAHVEKALADFASVGCSLGHERYGRDYTGNAIVEGWGPVFDENGEIDPVCYETKLNLIGHSFGGPTVTMLLQLLAYGDAAERDYAKAKYGEDDWKQHCSPLFWGDYEGENLINSITSLAGVLNGTTFIDSCDDSTELICSLAMGLANAIGPTCINDLYDFQLEQFGITKSDNPDYKYMFDLLQSVRFLDAKDNAIYDLSIGGCNELKQGWECFENVFYFAFPGCCTSESPLGTQIPNADTWPLFLGFATFMGAYTNKNEIVYDISGNEYCRVDKRWLPNDGMVNTFAQTHVFGCAQKDYDGIVEPGVWITMPSYGYDHFDFPGGLIEITQNSWQTKAFFDEIMKNIEATYNYVGRLAAPKLTASNVDYSNSVKLEWNKVEGASAYKIYRASSKNGSYSLLGTTGSTSCRDYATVLGKTYYYRIVAVNENNAAASEYSNVAELLVTYSKLSTYIVNKIAKRLF